MTETNVNHGAAIATPLGAVRILFSIALRRKQSILANLIGERCAMRHCCPVLITALSFAYATNAQAGRESPARPDVRVIIVDIEGRPGAHFRQIQPAIDAANPNDIIRVRASLGQYHGIEVTKPLRILGEPGVLVNGRDPGIAIKVSNLGLGQVLVLSWLEEYVNDPTDAGMVFSNNRGHVHCERITKPYFAVVQNCDQISFDQCNLKDVNVRDSDVEFVNTDCVRALGPGLDIMDSRVTIAGGMWSGDCGFPAIMMAGNSRLAITGDSATLFQASHFPMCRLSSAAIRATGGTIVLAPEPILRPAGSSMPIFGTATVIQQTIPYLRTAIANDGLVATLSATAGAQAFLLTSPFVPPVPVALHLPDLWTGLPIVVATGIVPSGAPLVDRIPVPASLPPGSALPFQSAVVVGGQLELSNPAVSVLRQ